MLGIKPFYPRIYPLLRLAWVLCLVRLGDNANAPDAPTNSAPGEVTMLRGDFRPSKGESRRGCEAIHPFELRLFFLPGTSLSIRGSGPPKPAQHKMAPLGGRK